MKKCIKKIRAGDILIFNSHYSCLVSSIRDEFYYVRWKSSLYDGFCLISDYFAKNSIILTDLKKIIKNEKK